MKQAPQVPDRAAAVGGADRMRGGSQCAARQRGADADTGRSGHRGRRRLPRLVRSRGSRVLLLGRLDGNRNRRVGALYLRGAGTAATTARDPIVGVAVTCN